MRIALKVLVSKAFRIVSIGTSITGPAGVLTSNLLKKKM
jgi:hypothetical protein